MLTARISGWIKEQAARRGLLVRRVPAGRQADAFRDQLALLAGVAVGRIFDVGAYHGVAAQRYHRLFPDAEIHCFEPVLSSFAVLEHAVRGIPRIIVNRAAVSDETGDVEMVVNDFAATSSRMRRADGARNVVDAGLLNAVRTETVRSVTLDGYCEAAGISVVDILKLDIQGGEAAALRGASSLLARSAVRVVLVELLLQQLYAGQPPASEVLHLLERHGYRIYGLYDFAYGRNGSVYQVDAVLIPTQ